MPRDDGSDLRRVFALKSFPDLDAMSLADIALLAQNAYEVFTPAGTVIARVDQPIEQVHFVVRGRFDLTRTGPTGRVTEHVDEHDVFGLVGALAGVPSRYDGVAAVDTWSLVLYADELTDLVEDHFMLLVAVLRALGRAMLDELLALPALAFPTFCSSAPALHPGPLGLSERILWLYHEPFGFGAGQIQPVAALARAAEEVAFPAGTKLWEAGAAADELIFVLSGKVHARRADGVGVDFGNGAPLGGLECLADLPRWYGATCTTDVRGLRIRPRDMFDVFEDHTDAGVRMVRAVALALDGLRSRQHGLGVMLPGATLSATVPVGPPSRSGPLPGLSERP